MRNTSHGPVVPVLSTTADHALRAVLALARHGVGRPLPATVLAAQIGSPANYTRKTLGVLARHGVLSSTRGPAGGFALVRPPADLTVAELARYFADGTVPRRCRLRANGCTPTDPCAAHHPWARLVTAAHDPLARTTVADLLATGPTITHPAGAHPASDSP